MIKKTKSARSRLILERKEVFTPMISAFLFFKPDAPAIMYEEYIAMKVKIRQMLKDTLNRKVLIEILLDLSKDLSGDPQEQLFRLYQDLGLHRDAFKKLNSWRWEQVSKGIEELTEMRVTQAYPFIKKFINDRRSVIRKQAQLASVTLRPEGISYFLDTARYRISDWQQMSLLDILRHKENFKPPRFKAWLISKNRDVVRFALRLIKYYNQNDAQEELIQLVRHRNNRVKLEAIECIDKFHINESLYMLKAVFKKGNTDVKIAILKAIANMGSEADLEFLKRVAEKDPNFIIRTKAEGSINAVSPGTIAPSEHLEDISPEAADNSEQVEVEYPDSFPERSTSAGNEVDPGEFQVLAAIQEAEDLEVIDQSFLEELQDFLAGTNDSLWGEEEPDLALDFLPHVLNEGEEKSKYYISELPVGYLGERAEQELPGLEDRNPATSGNTEPDPEFPEVDWESRRLDFEEFLDSGTIWDDIPQSAAFENEPETTHEANEFYSVEDDELIETTRRTEQEKDVPGTSIFAQLFDKTDRDGKLILLEEIRSIGEEKEYYFLNNLEEEDPVVLKVARKVVTELQDNHLYSDSEEKRTPDALENVNGSSLNRMPELDFEPDIRDETRFDSAPENLSAQYNPGTPILKILASWRQLINRN